MKGMGIVTSMIELCQNPLVCSGSFQGIDRLVHYWSVSKWVGMSETRVDGPHVTGVYSVGISETRVDGPHVTRVYSVGISETRVDGPHVTGVYK